MAPPRAKNAPPPAVIWFRDDLRLADNPALTAAADGRPVVCLYILDEKSAGPRPLGAAAKWWLHRSLESLSADLARHGQTLVLRRGAAARVLTAVGREAGANAVFWNRRYGRAGERDTAIEARLRAAGIAVETFKANLLFEPEELRSQTGEPFRVFSAFWRAALRQGAPRPPLPAPKRIAPPATVPTSETLAALDLMPSALEWTNGLAATWRPGEAGAHLRLEGFLREHLADYALRRDAPAMGATSTLSPYLRFGELSPFQIFGRIAAGKAPAKKFRSELGWREFAYHILGQCPDLALKNIRPDFDAFPWDEPESHMMWAWRRGATGYPIVDAGMRELWQTGWMHNRVRMIAASFLTKHLLADWRIGEEWFWDTLVDADPASNPFNWQWVAGSGADAQPFFRVFNPVLQGEKFDAEGAYVRRFVPELARLPNRFIHRPFEAPPHILAAAGIELGNDYPHPIVDHATARARALDAFAEMRGEGTKPLLVNAGFYF
jgi:deoxyribodipyrimidine photo-lyase